MNEPEPSAVANGSPPQASPFPFGRAAVSTPTDDAGNPLRRMRRDTLFCRSSYDSCRRQATGHSPKREFHASTSVQPVRPNAKRRKSPPKRGFTTEMRGSFCCPTRFAFARQPRKTQESDTSRLQKASNFIRRASRRQVRPPERPPSVPSGLCGAAAGFSSSRSAAVSVSRIRKALGNFARTRSSSMIASSEVTHRPAETLK